MAQLPGRDAAALTTVSLVVPSHQQGRFLRTCLESLLAQTHPDLEVLVQDNLSSDETQELLAEYAPRLASVRRERDAGQADALRRGFARASGEVFGWLNGDDMLMPDALRLVVDAFDADPALDVVHGHCAFLDEDGQFLRYFEDAGALDGGELLDYSDPLAQPSTLFRRRAYEAVGGVDPALHYTMDWDLWCRFARAGFRFRFLDEVLSGARLHAAAKTSRGGLGRWLEISRVNLRHTTRALPMLPVLRVASLLEPALAKASPSLHSVVRAAWRALAPPGRRVRSGGPAGERRGTTLEFPVYAWTSRVEALLDFGSAAAARPESVDFSLDGWSTPALARTASGLRASWSSEPRFVAALRLTARVKEALDGPTPRLSCRYERSARPDRSA